MCSDVAMPVSALSACQLVQWVHARHLKHVSMLMCAYSCLCSSGYFGWEDYFAPVVDAITSGGDYYLVANDFPGYLDAQVGHGQSAFGKRSTEATGGLGRCFHRV